MGDDAITEAWRAGRDAWPDIELDRARFAAHVNALPPDAVAKFPADVYLAAACVAGVEQAINTFDRDVLTASRGAIHAINNSPAFVEDALQKLRVALLVGDGGAPRLAAYAARGPLRAWVSVAAARTALMMRRSQKRSRETPVEDEDDWCGALAQVSTASPELDLLKRQYAVAFTAALRDAAAALEARLRTVLRMSFVDALSIDEIGAVYGVHRATAARWIQRACDELFGETRGLLAARLAISQTELDRVTALVQSQLEVSLSQLLPGNIE